MPMPAHNNPDIKQPEEYELEEFLPAHPKLNSDRYAIQHELRRRQSQAEAQSFEAVSDEDESADVHSKGSLMTVIEDLRNEMDPTVAPPVSDVGAEAASAPSDAAAPATTNAPVPLFQGE